MYVSFVIGRGLPEVSKARGGTMGDAEEECVQYEAHVGGPEARKVTEEVIAEKEEEVVDGFKKVLERLPCDDGLELGVEGIAVSFSTAITALPK
ncbi:uncharacterized protein BcabD6B2_29320 [Babesia caballi]|uniref:Uncharacterized protein n=1 Tax=Babesia caballi TaxID=5871 RepID=A0AAV4LUN2_BABCB|nr:hypothetical protein BcabD6B2_29320 [Babesia caballi]